MKMPVVGRWRIEKGLKQMRFVGVRLAYETQASVHSG